MSAHLSLVPAPRAHRYDKVRLVVGLVAPLLLVVLMTAACGNDDQGGVVAPGGASTTTTEPSPPTEPTDTTDDGGTDGEEAQGDDVPECEHSELDALLRPMFDAGDGPTVDRIEIENCEGGYARVLVVPEEANFETEQVFAQKVDGEWEVIDFGTGIECSDDDLGQDLALACQALGLGNG